jgi:hypothetical protein
VHVCADHTARA